MGFFSSGKKTDVSIEDCKKMVEKFFTSINHNEANQRMERPNQWFVERGSAIVFIEIIEDSKISSIRINSPSLLLPKENLLPFYRRLLEINAGLFNCAFAIIKDVVFLYYERPLAGLDVEELHDMIHALAYYSDEYDNILADEFGAKLYSEHIKKAA